MCVPTAFFKCEDCLKRKWIQDQLWCQNPRTSNQYILCPPSGSLICPSISSYHPYLFSLFSPFLSYLLDMFVPSWVQKNFKLLKMLFFSFFSFLLWYKRCEWNGLSKKKKCRTGTWFLSVFDWIEAYLNVSLGSNLRI